VGDDVAYLGLAAGSRGNRHRMNEDILQTQRALDDGVKVLFKQESVVGRERLHERGSGSGGCRRHNSHSWRRGLGSARSRTSPTTGAALERRVFCLDTHSLQVRVDAGHL
jgi:hypothetical protein